MMFLSQLGLSSPLKLQVFLLKEVKEITHNPNTKGGKQLRIKVTIASNLTRHMIMTILVTMKDLIYRVKYGVS